MCLGESSDIFEVVVEGLRGRKVGEIAFAELESAMQKAARAGGVDDEFCADGNWIAMTRAFEECGVDVVGEALEVDVVAEFGSGLTHGLHQVLVEVGAIPVGVGDGVVGAGGY